MQPKSRTGQGVREQCLDRARRHFSYRHGMAPGPRKGAEMSTGRGGTSKCRYSMGAKIFLLLLAVSTVAALFSLYQVLTY
ncbi:hypothetical protein IO089_002513 [Salmonella enterica]|nr:hypothetical protein [Salmonella enterica]